ncbi:TetR/AcrR family transcriptional regulator [Pseudonocardia sp. TRM90224]|uniref:TetR/AcrR family transcriptional regulator n=1 Tax=Pseudonocardia sp. TRM90224 TaxID=2812678 RepID=UPI001E28CA5A|nr:TetR/AcrR family transcriptional regulator [Pseudonocardia sp. TRM90224]
MSIEAESGTRARTRRAILDAAVTVLSERRTASMSEIADAANVARSTLHRYFADRAELIEALVDNAIARGSAAVQEAALDKGPATDAIRRLALAYFDLGPLMTFLWQELSLDQEDHPFWQKMEAQGDPMTEVVERGLADGSFDPAFEAEWIRHMFWAVVFSTWELVSDGRMARQPAISAMLRTIEKALATEAAGA